MLPDDKNEKENGLVEKIVSLFDGQPLHFARGVLRKCNSRLTGIALKAPLKITHASIQDDDKGADHA